MRRSRVRISVGPFSIYFFLMEDDIDVGGGAQSIKRFFYFLVLLSLSQPLVLASALDLPPVSLGRIPLRYGGYYYLARTYCYQFYAFNIDDSVKKPIKIWEKYDRDIIRRFDEDLWLRRIRNNHFYFLDWLKNGQNLIFWLKLKKNALQARCQFIISTSVLTWTPNRSPVWLIIYVS